MQDTSLRVFLANLFDYAGLFPPAQLPLETSIQNYAAYRLGEDAWMLGRMIIPVARLDGLDPYIPLFSDRNRLSCAALGRKSVDEASCLEGLMADLDLIHSFHERHGSVADIGVLELPLPPSIPDPECLKAISAHATREKLEVFLEVTVPLNGDWEEQMIATLDAVSQHNAETGITLGMKLRTGGLTAVAFPTPAQVAAVLLGCRDRRIPLKFTAGLHHPVRMYREEVKTHMHGFLNVYIAVLLAHAENIDRLLTEEILGDEEPSNFSFADGWLGWKNYRICTADIARLRSTVLRSYGTCSFDEPRDDLRALKFL